jgi:diguanylate cyclase (GGDEF)-like protein
MVTTIVAACAVLAACVFTLVVLRRSKLRSDRRLEASLALVEQQLASMSAEVARAVGAVADVVAQRPPALLTLDFDELLNALVTETARRTGADAVALRVEGPDGRPVIATHGPATAPETLDRSFGPPGARSFDAAVIDWTYSPSGEPEDAAFRSALVTPLAATAGVPGALAAYSYTPDAFDAEHASAIRALLRDTGVALANARRFAEIEARVNIDPLTGVQSRRGYELELGREVARATRTGRPLSVVVVDVSERNGQTAPIGGGRIGDVARLVTRVTRRTDISCRRGERELAILLPGTEEAGAAVLTRRIEAEARSGFDSGTSTVTVGLLAHEQNESPEALDDRIERLFGRPRSATVAALDDVRSASTAATSTVHASLASGAEAVRREPAEDLRRDVLGAFARELVDARRFGRSLALVALGIDGLDDIADGQGRETADATFSELAGRLDRSIGTGSAHRLAATVFALVLPGSELHEAEALVDALQSSLEPPHDDAGLVLSAGITEVAEDEDADATLGRAEHALWQAQQAGRGTVVVAVPGKRSAPPD